MVTSAGALALQNYIPKEDASAVARLRRAGAILLGKTNVPIFTGDFQAYNCIYGTSNNPWKQDFSPGVSSGGAAAAIATPSEASQRRSRLQSKAISSSPPHRYRCIANHATANKCAQNLTRAYARRQRIESTLRTVRKTPRKIKLR